MKPSARTRPDPETRSGSTYRSSELRLVATLAAVLLLGCWLLLAYVDWNTDFLMLDFRRWHPSSSAHPASERYVELTYEQFFEGLQPSAASQRALRMSLAFQGNPVPDRVVAAERKVPVHGRGPYCLEIFAWSPYHRPDSPAAVKTFRAQVFVNDEVVASIPIADSSTAERITASGISPRNGEIHLRAGVRSYFTRDAESWRRASLVHFEFASLLQCKKER